MGTATTSLIVAPVLATALLAHTPVRDVAVWDRPGVSCMPAATRAVALGYLSGPVRGAAHPALPHDVPDAQTISPSCTPHKVIRT
jgi:hypothetical protein